MLNLQVFDTDNDVVFADVVRDLVYEIISGVGDFRMQFSDTGFRFAPVLRELFLLCHAALQFRQLRQQLFQRLALVDDLTIRQGGEIDTIPKR